MRHWRETEINHNLNNYILKGTVLPVRATLTTEPRKMEVQFGMNISNTAIVEISILCNEISIFVDTEDQIDVLVLRNNCISLLDKIIAPLGYYFGYGYSYELTQIICKSLDVNLVFGINVGCLEHRRDRNLANEFIEKVYRYNEVGEKYIRRCFADLQLAIKHPIDTPFYCYRAIECLKQFCREKYNLSSESDQWKKLSELTNKNWEDTKIVKEFANNARHGDHKDYTSEQSESFFTSTWDLIDAFLEETILKKIQE